MRATETIVFDVTGQSLSHRCLQGQPTSATFIVLEDYANDDAVAEFSGSATVDTVATTVDVASGISEDDPHRINLTATTGIVTSRKYLLSENGMQEWVEPIEIVSASHIRVRHPLRNDYTTAATFVGTTIAAAVDATWVAEEAHISDHADPNPDYRVRWEFVVGGATYVEYSYFDLTRSTVGHHVDIGDLNDRAPGLHDTLPLEYRHDQGRALINSAWRAVQAKLSSLRIDTDGLRNDQITDELVIVRALYMLAMGGWSPLGMTPGEYIVATRDEYERFVEQHFQAVLNVPVADGTSSGADLARAVPFWSK